MDSVSLIMDGVPLIIDDIPLIMDSLALIMDSVPLIMNALPLIMDGIPLIMDGIPLIMDGVPLIMDGIPLNYGWCTSMDGVPLVIYLSSQIFPSSPYQHPRELTRHHARSGWSPSLLSLQACNRERENIREQSRHCGDIDCGTHRHTEITCEEALATYARLRSFGSRSSAYSMKRMGARISCMP